MNIAALGLAVTFGMMTGAVLSKVGVNSRQSLSQHIAKTPQTIAYGKAGLTLGGVLFAFALLVYATPMYHLGAWFVATASLACVLGTVTAYLPYGVSKRQNLWHDVCSYGYVALNPVILSLILVELSPGIVRGSYLAGIVLQVAIILLLVAFRPARSYFLFGQVVFMSVFALLLVAL